MSSDAIAFPGKKQKDWFRSNSIPLNVILFIGSIAMVLPFIWMVLSAFKSPAEIVAFPPTWIPREFIWKNFSEAWTFAPFNWYFANSLMVAVATTLSGVFFGSMAGFSFAKYKCWGKGFFFLAIISGMMIPIHIKLVPQLYICKTFGWINTRLGLIMPEIITIYGVFLCRQFMKSIPDELIDAARIDGSSEWRIYWQIMLPLCRPVLATLAIFRFMWSWNDFLWPVIIIASDTKKTLPIGLAGFVFEFRTEYNILMAASTISVIPVLVVFFLMQKQFIQGIALTGLKS